MADAVARLTYTGEAQLYWHVYTVQIDEKYKHWEDMRAHQKMWLGRVGKQQYTQWEDVLLTDFFQAMRGLVRIQEDEAAAIEAANRPT